MTEQISALIDDELTDEEVMRALHSMQSSKQAMDAWSQYHLIGDAMRSSAMLSAEFKQNLMQRLDAEPTVLAPNAVQSRISTFAVAKNSRLPVKWSIAASVAAVMVVGWVAMHEQTQPANAVAPIALARVELPQADTSEQSIPAEYLMAHQSSAPSASSHYIQSASYAE